MRSLLPDQAAEYLGRQGLESKRIKETLSGFDLKKPMWEEQLDSGTQLFQFQRSATLEEPMSRVGNWFCLAGATLSGIGIISGAGRDLALFRIEHPVSALGGTASPIARDWKNSLGGRGGQTQYWISSVQVRTCLRHRGVYTGAFGVARRRV